MTEKQEQWTKAATDFTVRADILRHQLKQLLQDVQTKLEEIKAYPEEVDYYTMNLEDCIEDLDGAIELLPKELFDYDDGNWIYVEDDISEACRGASYWER